MKQTKLKMRIVKDYKRPSLTIYKYDMQEKTPIPNTVFEVYCDTVLLGTYTTDSKGEINLRNLKTGTYVVKEISTDSNHVVNSTPQQIEIKEDSGDTAVLVFLNQQKPYIRLVKLDSETMQPLPNAKFLISKVGDSFSKEYVTDENGEIKLDKLDGGAYTVKEISAPSGYIIDDNIRTIQLNPDEYATFVFTNTKKPTLKLLKYDPVQDKYLSGATFRISKIEDGSHYLDRVTDINGIIEINNLDEGIYSVKEIAAPSGYVVNDTEYHIELFGGKTSQLVVINELKPSLKIVKTDAVTGEPIKGVVFTVKKVDGETVTTVTTNDEGEVLLAHLDPAVYEIIEKSVPNDYLLDETPQYITLVPNKTGTVNFKNYPKPTLTINKVDSVTGLPLKGAKFSIVYASNSTFTGELNDLGIYFTDENGQIVITHRIDGWYKITELAPPENYVMKEQIIQEFFIKAGENKTVTFENTKKPNLTVHKVDSITKDPIKNAKFTIWRAKNGSLEGEIIKVGDYISDKDGKIILENLEPGWYRVKETEPAYGYSIKSPDTQDIFLEAGKDKEITFENKPKNAIIIRKVDADTGEMLPGARFTIRHASGISSGTSGTVIGEYLTSNNGTIVVTGLKAGAYIVEEVQAPLGYIMVENAPQTVWITEDETSVVEVTFVNRKEAGLLIKKMDSVTKEPLSDVIFKVTDSKGTVVGESNGEYRTDENGFIHITGLTPGAYVVKEVQTKSGYILDNTPQTVHIQFGKLHSLEFFNTPVSSLTIKKMDATSKKPLADAVFKVITSDGQILGNSNGEFRTDENGLIVINGLPSSATLIVKELRAPDGYLLDDNEQTLKVEPNKAYSLEFYNKPLAPLQIKKTDSVTGKPLGGAVFKVTKMNGELVGEYTTTSDGFISIPELEPGWYVVSELRAPDGYIADSTPKNVEVKTEKPVLVEFVNRPMAGLQIHKVDGNTGESLRNARFKVTKMNGEYVGDFTTGSGGYVNVGILEPGWYTILETRAPTGYLLDETPRNVEIKYNRPVVVEFENYSKAGLQIKKISEQTGKPIENVEFAIDKVNGEHITTVTTNYNGTAYVTLEPGWYTVTERYAPSGFELDPTPYNVQIKAGEPTVLTLCNKQLSTLRIRKIDSETRKGIYGARFLVRDSKNNIIGEYSTDQSGIIDLTHGITAGRYKIEEIAAGAGYVLDTVVKTVDIKNAETTEIIWENTPIKGQIQIVKKLLDYNSINGFPAGSLLQGATFEIYDKAGNKVDTVVSNANGLAASKSLPLGRYTIKETIAPQFYSINTNTPQIELEFAGQIVKIEILNQSVYTNVSVKKRGYTEVVPNQSIRYDFSNIANNSTISLNSFYWRDTLPTDAVRLSKIITGTWNAHLSYKVVYRTNISGDDYRTLADNLQTSKNYALDASHAALGLASNEYVTEFMFMFGTVPAGFSQVEAPYIFCSVLGNLPHEYRFTNKTDVGALWGGRWIMATDRFVTIVYNKTTPIKLPRTGY